MMMKLLPFVAVAVAEKRFLTKGKAIIDGTNKNVMFDKAVNDAAGTAAATDAISMTNGVIYMGGKDDASSITGLTTGNAYMLKKPAGTPTGNWKTHSRLVAGVDGVTVDGVADTTLPTCDNLFIESSNAGAAVKFGTNIQASVAKGGKDAQVSFTIDATNSALTAGDFLYLACKLGGKPHPSLKCNTTYLAGTVANTNDWPIKTSASGEVKGAADHSTGIVYTDMWFVEVATKTPKTLNVCTAKASATRMAAFVSGMIAYALLI